jgi:hypothetical protein
MPAPPLATAQNNRARLAVRRKNFSAELQLPDLFCFGLETGGFSSTYSRIDIACDLCSRLTLLQISSQHSIARPNGTAQEGRKEMP